MKVLIVDDEQLARERLRQILDDEDGYDVVGEAENGAEAIALAARLQPDVVLLDIRMPGLDGIETAHHLNTLENSPAIVFATAFDEYAVDAFEARAIGYILKPVRRAKLTSALEQASRLASNTLTAVATEAHLPSVRKHVCIRIHDELRLIPIADVICFRADQKYVMVEHDNGQHLIDASLKSLAEEFSNEFVRIHRGALIALRHMDRIEKNTQGKSCVILRGNSQVDDKELIISRRHLAEVRRRLKGV